MSMTLVNICIRPAAVSDVNAVREFLGEYDDVPLEVVASGGGGAGIITLREGEHDRWPVAVRVDEMPDENDFEDDGAWDEAVFELRVERGEQGFADLLLRLAPHIRERLVVQAASFDSAGDYFRAVEWAVEPGAGAVEVKEIVSMKKE